MGFCGETALSREFAELCDDELVRAAAQEPSSRALDVLMGRHGAALISFLESICLEFLEVFDAVSLHHVFRRSLAISVRYVNSSG